MDVFFNINNEDEEDDVDIAAPGVLPLPLLDVVPLPLRIGDAAPPKRLRGMRITRRWAMEGDAPRVGVLLVLDGIGVVVEEEEEAAMCFFSFLSMNQRELRRGCFGGRLQYGVRHGQHYRGKEKLQGVYLVGVLHCYLYVPGTRYQYRYHITHHTYQPKPYGR